MALTGLIGGTFNPVHYGHLIIAQEVKETLKLDRVIFIPNGIPPHKEIHMQNTETRLELLKLAVSDNPMFGVSDLEMKRQDKSYTVDTVAELKIQIPNDKFVFIAGIDAFVNYEWFKFEELLELLDCFVVVCRPGLNLDSFNAKLNTIKNQAKIKYLQVPLIEISSTDIRKRVAEGRSIRYMLPGRLERYILENRLYRS